MVSGDAVGEDAVGEDAVARDAVGGDAPLRGVRVVDLTRFVSGSYAGMLLAAFGADVVKIEALPDGDPYRSQGTAFVAGESALFQALNTGKRSIALDLKSDAGRDLLDRLLAVSDVLLENGRPGSLAGIGFDAAAVTARHPHVVYGSVSGYGQDGPDAAKGGFDLILQAEGGIMSVTGAGVGEHVKVGVPILDIGSAISCALGVVSALYRKERSGSGAGAVVSSSLLEFAVASFTSVAPTFLVDGQVPAPMGSNSPTFAPYGAFAARDGHLVVAGAGSESLWQRFCAALGADELVDDPRFRTNADRVGNLDALTVEIERRLAAESVQTWLDRLAAAGVPAGQVRDLGQVLDSAQVRALGMVRTVETAAGSYRAVGPPVRVDGALDYPRPAPKLGEHTEEILAELDAAGGGSRDD